MKRTVSEGRQAAIDDFAIGKTGGRDTSIALTRQMDRYLLGNIGPCASSDGGWAVTAVGSYGRSELSFGSDVDCMLLHVGPEPRHAVRKLEQSVRELWNTGIRASVAVYRLDRALNMARRDDRVLSSLLDRRPLFGGPSVLASIERRLGYLGRTRMRRFARFLEDEGDRRAHDRNQDLFASEPDIKTGRGCLRDLASIGWLVHLADLVPADSSSVFFRRVRQAAVNARGRRKPLDAALETLLSVRHHMGGVLGARRECLTRSVAPGKDFGPDLCRARVEVSCVREALIDAFVRDGPRPRRGLPAGCLTTRGVLYVPDPVRAGSDPMRLLEILSAALPTGLAPEPAMACAARSVPWRSSTGGQALVELLCQPSCGEALTWLHRFGLLPSLLPALSDAEGLVPGDEIHAYTVDRHSVMAAGNMARLLDGEAELPQGTDERLPLERLERVPLLLAALLHDVGKAMGPPHMVNGSRKAHGASLRLGLSRDQAKMVRFLCLKHMVLPEASTGLDCEDPTVQSRLAESLESSVMLDGCFLLAIADMRSLGPDVDTGFREELLARTWHSVRTHMEGQSGSEASRATAIKRRDQLIRRMERSAHTGTWASTFVADLPHRFLTAFDSATLWSLVRMLRESRASGSRASIRALRARGSYDVTWAGPDDLGLLSSITGSLALEGLSIQEARIFTLPGRLVLDRFRVSDTSGRILSSRSQRERVSDLVAGAARDRSIHGRVVSRMGSTLRALEGEYVAEMDNGASERGTVLRVTGPDAPGLLHLVAHILFIRGIDVTGAIVTTEAGIVQDIFFTETGGDGGKVTDPETIRRVLRAITHLGDVEEGTVD